MLGTGCDSGESIGELRGGLEKCLPPTLLGLGLEKDQVNGKRRKRANGLALFDMDGSWVLAVDRPADAPAHKESF